MHRPAKFACIILISLAAANVPGAEKTWVTRSNDNAQLLLQVMAKYSPENASRLGVEGYDEAITDYSRDLYVAQIADTRRVIGELRKRMESEADAKVRPHTSMATSA